MSKVYCKNFEKNDCIKVIWIDHETAIGWQDASQMDYFAKNGDVYWTVGIFIKETEEYVIVAQDKDGQNKYGYPCRIPKGCIKAIIKLEE